MCSKENDEIPKDAVLWESSLEHFPRFNLFL